MHSPTRAVCGVLLTALLMVCAQQRAQSWGFEAHYFILERALDLMPEPTRPFFQKYRAFIVSHTIDPDLWRNVGFDEIESPRHFIDLDAYGTFPFDDLPRDQKAAIQKFGAETVTRNGILPWRVADTYGELVRAFQDVQRERGGALDRVKLFTAVLAHYVADGHMPLHASANHDGQLTKQTGIHARWESDLYLRYRDKLTIKPTRRAPVKDPRDAMFAVVLESSSQVEALLAADRKAVIGRELYDDAYFAALFAETKPLLERRVTDAISSIAAFVAGAWETGGRPALPLEFKRAPRKVPRS